jgi:hypothetical protein
MVPYIVMTVVLLIASYFVAKARTKERQINETMDKWKRNPTKMDLTLATTKQILTELSGRQPMILVVPEIPKRAEDPIQSVQLYVLGIHPQHARILLHGAGELLAQGGGTFNSPNDQP